MFDNNSVTSLLQYADISMYLCAQEYEKEKYYNSVDETDRLEMIDIVKDVVRYYKPYKLNSNSYDKLANYLYTLIGKWISQAAIISNNTQGIIVGQLPITPNQNIGFNSDININPYNMSANAFFSGFTSIVANGSTITLTIYSTPEYLVTGLGGQSFKLPDATTLQRGTIFSFNNSQSSGNILVNNNSNTLVKSAPSGSYLTLELIDNSTSDGVWETHFKSASNAVWSNNTLDYTGSITSATWNGNLIAYNRGGTGQSSAFTQGGIMYGSSTTALASSAVGIPGQVLISNGSSAPIWSDNTGGAEGGFQMNFMLMGA